MAFGHGTAARFYWHTFDMSGYAEEVSQQLSRSMAEYRPLNGNSVRRFPGHRDVQISLAGGALDPAAGANDAYVFARMDEDTPRVFAFLPSGDVLGRVAYCGQTLHGSHQRTVGDDVVRLPVAVMGTSDIDRCVVLRALTAGGISPGSNVDGGAATDNGGAAYLICTAISGAGATLTVTVEDSANGVDFGTLVEMTALTAVGSEVKVVTGEVLRYLRISWTLTGTNPAATWFAAFGRR